MILLTVPVFYPLVRLAILVAFPSISLYLTHFVN